VGRYVVLETLGSGGMGVVYAAYDPELDRKVALKLLREEMVSRSRELRARMMREAQALARLSHPNVVAVFDVGTFGESVFLAMELVHGATPAPISSASASRSTKRCTGHTRSPAPRVTR
jgi:serine/threonine protein kinase